jgi:adenylate cyclase class 2
LEAEIKIPVADIFVDVDLKAYITQIIGASEKEIVQIDTYFRSPVNDFYSTDEALRIRRILSKEKKEKVELTYKGPKSGMEMKIREEVTSGIIHYTEAIKILEQLGFSIVKEVSKKRTNWYDQSITLSLDEVEGLGKFIEIELMTSKSHSIMEKNKKKLLEFTHTIFPKWNGKEERKSYLELLTIRENNSG